MTYNNCEGLNIAYGKWYVKVYVYITRHPVLLGQKRCQICEIFIKWDGIFCPCCGCRLRIGTRLFKDKAKLRIREKQKENQTKKSQMKNYSNIILHAP